MMAARVNRLRPLLLTTCLALAAGGATAQVAPASTTTSAAPVAVEAPQPALTPFDARYAVFRDGKPLGDASLQLVALGAARWRVDLRIEATRGLMGLAGVDLQQSTVFDVAGNQYRPLSQATVRKALFGKRQVTGTYDWTRHAAQWTGDVKKKRRGAVPLQEGDMSGLLINLAVQRDALPGATLRYRFVDEGRAREQLYQVSAQREAQQVDDLSYAALRVDRVRAGADTTTLWVVEAVPMPIRIFQRDDEGETLELRLIDYREV